MTTSSKLRTLLTVLGGLGALVLLTPASAETYVNYMPSHSSTQNAFISGAARNGVATHYAATGGGACSYDPVPGDMMVVAINRIDFANASACGSFLNVNGPNGAVTVRVVDVCPECAPGQLDLSREAFAQLAPLNAGKINIVWQATSPNVSGAVQYRFKEGSNQWWTAVQLRNHRNAIARLEARGSDGRWIALTRTNYNYFVKENPGLGQGPYTFRVTDVSGNIIIDDGVPHAEGRLVAGRNQHPFIYNR